MARALDFHILFLLTIFLAGGESYFLWGHAANASDGTLIISGKYDASSRFFRSGMIKCADHGKSRVVVKKESHLSGIQKVQIHCDEIRFEDSGGINVDHSIEIVAKKIVAGSGAYVVSLNGTDGLVAPGQASIPPKSGAGNVGAGGGNGGNASSGVRWEMKKIGFIKTKVPVPYSHGASAGGGGARGGDGQAGSVGIKGIDGGDGKNGGRIAVTVNQTVGKLRLISPGGNGGAGGKGGRGGEGGNGGQGGHGGKGGDGIVDHGPANGGQGGPGGNGGQGGIGGAGGNGGNGGNGGDIAVQMVSGIAIEHFAFENNGGVGGAGGAGGDPGVGGAVGGGGPGGCGGSTGSGDIFRSDGKCGGWGGNGTAGAVGTAGRAGSRGLDGQAGAVGLLDSRIVPIEDFNKAFGGV